MPDQKSIKPDAAELRKLASRKLRQLGKDSTPIVESYLFAKECFVGVRFVSGPFCVLWKSPQDYVSIMRGELLIENVSLVENSEVRRAA